MRALYVKRSNIIYLLIDNETLEQDIDLNFEGTEVIKNGLSIGVEVPIYCSSRFWEGTQKRPGKRGWTPEELESRVRGAVANHLLNYEADKFDEYARAHAQVLNRVTDVTFDFGHR